MDTILFIIFFICFIIVLSTNVQMIIKHGFKDMSETLAIKGKEGDEKFLAMAFNFYNIYGILSLMTAISFI